MGIEEDAKWPRRDRDGIGSRETELWDIHDGSLGDVATLH